MRASRASREGPAAPGRSGRRRETPPGVSGGGFGAAGLRHATVGASATRRLARPPFSYSTRGQCMRQPRRQNSSEP